MTKFLHIADTHLDYQQYGLRVREQDGYDAFEAVIEYAVSEQVEAFLIAGDFFHSKDIRARAWLRVRRLLEKAKMFGIRVVMVEGNHDRALFGSDETWVETLESEGLATVLGSDGDPQWVDIDGVRIIGIPYLGHKETGGLDQVREWLDKLEAIPAILLCHIGVFEVMGGVMQGLSLADLEARLHPSIEYVATGHFHRPWSKGWVHCPGTVFPCKIDEPYGGMFQFEADKDGVRDVIYVPISDIYEVRPILRPYAEGLEQVTALSSEWNEAIVQLTYKGDDSRGMLESVLRSTPLKLMVTYQSSDEADGRKLYQSAASTSELEMFLLADVLGDESPVAAQLMQYAIDGQSSKAVVALVKERVGIVNAD